MMLRDPETSPVVLLTGASRGIGAQAARALAARGARLALLARSEEALKALAGELPTEVLLGALDVTDHEASARFVQETLQRFGRLDALINNAAVLGPTGPTSETDLARWRRAVEVNLLAPLALTRSALGALRDSQGRVIQVSTGAAIQPLPHFGAYCATKAALTQLARVLALEEPSITTLCFSPGVVDTGMQEEIRREAAPRMPDPWGRYFLDLPRRGALQSPQSAGLTLAWLALKAPREWSGQMVDGDDERIRRQAQDWA
jgi:NAD(P)-dependent dehydrogenase (short-subunit alcohol dehydrogenase family)